MERVTMESLDRNRLAHASLVRLRREQRPLGHKLEHLFVGHGFYVPLRIRAWTHTTGRKYSVKHSRAARDSSACLTDLVFSLGHFARANVAFIGRVRGHGPCRIVEPLVKPTSHFRVILDQVLGDDVETEELVPATVLIVVVYRFKPLHQFVSLAKTAR